MFNCCGLKYKKSDIDTYWCIESYVVKPVIQKFVKDERVFSEVIETCICKKCGLQMLQLKRFGRKNGRKHLLEVVEMKGQEADLFIVDNQDRLKLQPQICPVPVVACATSLPASFPLPISPEKQRTKYIASLPQKDSWRNKFINGRWVPDIFQSQCRIIANA